MEDQYYSFLNEKNHFRLEKYISLILSFSKKIKGSL